MKARSEGLYATGDNVACCSLNAERIKWLLNLSGLCEHGVSLETADWFEVCVGLRSLDLSYFALIAHNYTTFIEGWVVALKTLGCCRRKVDNLFPQ